MKKYILASLTLCSLWSVGAIRDEATIVAALKHATNRTEWIECYKGISEQEWNAMAESYLSDDSTPLSIRQKKFFNSLLVRKMRSDSGWALVSAYEQRLAEVGYYTFPNIKIGKYPCLSLLAENWLKTSSATNFANRCPTTLATIRASRQVPEMAFPELISVLSEIAPGDFLIVCNYTALKAYIMKKAPSAIKKALRAIGKSFVVKGDNNPMEEPIEKLTAALDAPRYSGLKEWMSTYYPTYMYREPEWKTDEEIEKIKSAVFFGETEMTPAIEIVLQTHLGIVEYNKFVKAYNGED